MAITAAVERDYQEGVVVAIPMDASAGTVPKGALVSRDATGYGVNASDTASETFAGVAYESKTFAGSSDGDTKVKVYRKYLHRFAWNGGDAAETDVNVECCVYDNDVVAPAADVTNNLACGIVRIRENADYVWVDIEGYC